MTSTPLVHIENLTVRFGDPRSTPVVDGISLSIAAGECVAIVGESGSGKSVTARSLVGLAGPGSTVTADRLEVGGRNLLTLSRRGFEKVRGPVIGTISQDALSGLDPLRLVGREVDDALRLHTRLRPTERRARVLELLTDAGIPDPEIRAAQRSGQLSGGLRQRALIAAALAATPQLLIADEPTTALDSQVRDGVLELIAQQVDNGMAVLVISHDLSVVASIAHRVAVMTAGSIVEEGPTESVLSSPRHPYTQRLLAATPAGKPRHTPLLRERVTMWAPASASSTATWSSAANPGQRPTEPAPPLALEARDLSVSFASPDGAKRPVLTNLSFALPAGTTLGLVGPSGSGKTTLARIALGLQRPDSGELRLLGQDWSGIPERDRRARRHWLGAIYQDPLASFDPRFTVGQLLTDAVTDGVGTRSTWALPRVHQLLDSVGLSTELAGRRPRSLSGGQRQRVAIARALAANPRVLILDEPVSSLDVTIQAQILDLLDDLQREFRLSYLFISHDVDVIDHMSDDVLDLASN